MSPYSWVMNHQSWTRWRSSVWKPQRLVWSCPGQRLGYRISALAHYQLSRRWQRHCGRCWAIYSPGQSTTSTHLGSQQGVDGYCRSDMMRCIGLDCAVVASLQRIWLCSSLSRQTKVHLYRSPFPIENHLIRGSLGPSESSTQTPSRLVQPFLQGH